MINDAYSEIKGCDYKMRVTSIPETPTQKRVVYVRFLNAVPSLPAVDIYLNGQLLFDNVAYRNFTDYIKVPAGVYDISFYTAGRITTPILIQTVNFVGGFIYTAALSGEAPLIGLELINDTPHKRELDKSFIRFIHLSPNTPAVDIYIDNEKIIPDIFFREVSPYIDLSPGSHTVKINLAGSDTTVLKVPVLALAPGNYYAGYIVGYSDGKIPSLELLAPLEGTTYIQF